MRNLLLGTACAVSFAALLGQGCAKSQVGESEGAPLRLGPGYVTLKMSSDGQHAELVEPRSARDRRIADLEKRVADLESNFKKLSDAAQISK